MSSLRQWGAAAVAGLISRLPLNRVARVDRAGRVFYRKRRRWYAPGVIAAGRLAGARFVVLSGAAWHQWESAVYRQVYGEAVAVGVGGALEVPARPGAPLAQLLAAAPGAPGALAACEAALDALADLHRRTVLLPGGEAVRLTHGDARVANVTYDAASCTAYWFDFETVAPHRPLAWRQADDLRALIYSAAAIIGPARGACLARRAAAHYAGSPVPAQLRGIIAELRRRPDPLHLAQTRIGPAQADRLARALLDELGRYAPAS